MSQNWSMKHFVVKSIYSMLHDYLFVTVIPQIGKQSNIVSMHAMKAHGGVEL
jgi:hypothetical protein